MTTATQRRYVDVDHIKLANKNFGGHWFDRSTMRFFDSRVGHAAYGGRYFISSERYDHNSPRLYTIRAITEDRSIDTVGDFQAYASHAAAARAVRKIVAAEGGI